ncbi:MAG: hypothetical protein KAV87_37060, partial [Desulfobacteraceae bacterium]|nr:hypothetical protein [Desulfobacteraceae bacterium]
CKSLCRNATMTFDPPPNHCTVIGYLGISQAYPPIAWDNAKQYCSRDLRDWRPVALSLQMHYH